MKTRSTLEFWAIGRRPGAERSWGRGSGRSPHPKSYQLRLVQHSERADGPRSASAHPRYSSTRHHLVSALCVVPSRVRVGSAWHPLSH
eukprot:1386554-Pyramimonas_sp.AAC.1